MKETSLVSIMEQRDLYLSTSVHFFTGQNELLNGHRPGP
jgi:hypothetical protein